MKRSIRLLLGIILLCIIVLVFVLCFVFKEKTITIGFYDIPETTKESFVSLITESFSTEKKSLNISFINIPESQIIKNEKKPSKLFDILITKNNRIASELANTTIDADIKNINTMPTSIRKTAYKNKKPYITPLLLDHLEVAYLSSALKNISALEPRSLTTLEETALELKKTYTYPVIIAGKEQYDLILFITAMIESLTGDSGYTYFCDNLTKGVSFTDSLDLQLNEEYTFKDILNLLISWKNRGILFPEWYYMTHKDLLAYMEAKQSPIVFMPFSVHRTIPNDIINSYSSLFMPSGLRTSSRSLVAPVICALQTSNKQNSNGIVPSDIISFLSDIKTQTYLSTMTKLSPVNSNCEVQDKQAYDVRLWVASAHRPLNDIASESILTKEDQDLFINELRLYLTHDGF